MYSALLGTNRTITAGSDVLSDLAPARDLDQHVPAIDKGLVRQRLRLLAVRRETGYRVPRVASRPAPAVPAVGQPDPGQHHLAAAVVPESPTTQELPHPGP